jgi:hypothetical protein
VGSRALHPLSSTELLGELLPLRAVLPHPSSRRFG